MTLQTRYRNYDQPPPPSTMPNTPQAIIRKRKNVRKMIQKESPGATVVFNHGECFVDMGDGFERFETVPVLRKPGGNRRPEGVQPKSAQQRLDEGRNWYLDPLSRYYKPTPEPKTEAPRPKLAHDRDPLDGYCYTHYRYCPE